MQTVPCASVVAFATLVQLAALPASARGESALVVDGVLGAAFLGHARSHALGHVVKPAARLGVRVPLAERWEVGAALSGLVDGSSHYGVLGALAHARLAVWQGATWSMGTALALGAGHDADILHRDLHAEGTVIPYGFLALDARWSLGALLLGAEAAWEDLSLLRLGLVVGFRGRAP